MKPLALFLLFLAVPRMLLGQSPNALHRWSAAHAVTAPIVPPRPEWRAWYDDVVAHCGCTPAAAFDDIVWRVVRPDGPDGRFDCLTGRCLGWWWPDDEIFIAAGDERTRWLVQHELLHAVLHRGDHPLIFGRYTPLTAE